VLQNVDVDVLDVEENFRSLENKKVVLFGAGLYLPIAIFSLGQHNIKVVSICDNDIEKQGKNIYGLDILSPEESAQKYTDAVFIISTYPKYINEIKRQLYDLGVKKIKDTAFCFARFEVGNDDFSEGISYINFQLETFFYDYFTLFYPQLLVLPSLDVVITEKCSLRCKDCANLMPHFENPQNIDYDSLFASVDKVMNEIDYLLEFRVLGGEAFMNPEAYRFINRLRQYDNYGRIAVYSNGTIVPAKENLTALKHEDTFVRISNYGSISKNLQTILDVFAKERIYYACEAVDKWQDCAHVKKIERTQQELKQTFATCCAKTTLSLLYNKIHICPFSSSVFALHLLPEDIEEAVNLSDSETIRQGLYRLLHQKKYFEICKYCPGRDIRELTIPAAIQTGKTLKSLKK